MTTEGLEIRPADASPAQLVAYSDLLGRVFGPQPKFTPAALTWLYRDNPQGGVVGSDAWSGDILAAHYVTIPMHARIHGKSARGLLSLNTATDPAFQGQGLFTHLASATYQAARDQGFQFVFGVANANSTPGFLRKLGFQKVSRLEAGLLLHPPRRMAEVQANFQTEWSPEALTWRLANPAAHYKIARRGNLLSVWAETGIPLLRCAAFLSEPCDTANRRQSPWTPPLFIGLDPRFSLKRRGFIPIPDLLRPTPLNMIWKALDPALPETLSPDHVVVNFLDFDPY